MKTIAKVLIFLAGVAVLGVIAALLMFIFDARSERRIIMAVFGGLAVATLIARVVLVFKDSFFPPKNKTYKPRK
jgi:hypothetical protein